MRRLNTNTTSETPIGANLIVIYLFLRFNNIDVIDTIDAHPMKTSDSDIVEKLLILSNEF